MASPAPAPERTGAGEAGGRDRRAVAIPGSCGARYAGAGIKDLGPTNPAPGAGTCRLYGPKVSFIFNLKIKNPPTWLFQTFPCLYRNQLLIHPSCFPRAYTFRFGNKRNSLTSGNDGRVNLCVLFIGFARCSRIAKTLQMVQKLNICPFTT